MTSYAYLEGNLAAWPSMGEMAALLQSAGLQAYVGRYSIRIGDFSHFIFEEYGGDLGDPQIDADAEDVETMAAQAKRVSDIFTRTGLVHRFEIYQEGSEEMTHYFHYGWPLGSAAPAQP